MFSYLLNKFLSLVILIRYGKLPVDIKYYYRHTYICRLRQIRYFVRDYIIKKPYKEISFSGEFGADLMFAMPFAYWHHLNGTLKSTRAPLYTRELYFFSENHQEVFEKRSDEGNYNFELLRILYSQDYDIKKWVPVPLKAHFKNDIYVFEKPILIIANRYNTEWDAPPISFFDLPTLDFMINALKEKYTIIYNRPKPKNIVEDSSEIFDLKDFEWLEANHPEVLMMNDLYDENKGGANNYNHFQMMIYANADRFISIHGGTASFASYFGGINLILSKQGPEHHFGCFTKFFPQFSGATILHAKTDEELKAYVVSHFI